MRSLFAVVDDAADFMMDFAMDAGESLLVIGALALVTVLAWTAIKKIARDFTPAVLPKMMGRRSTASFKGVVARIGTSIEGRHLFQLREHPEEVFCLGMDSVISESNSEVRWPPLKEGDTVEFSFHPKKFQLQTPEIFDFRNHSYKGPALT